MSPLLKRCYLGLKKGIIYVLALIVLSVFIFFTPIFSSVGLWVLNHLPIPDVNIVTTPQSVVSPTQQSHSVEASAHMTDAGSLTHAKPLANQPSDQFDSEPFENSQLNTSNSSGLQRHQQARPYPLSTDTQHALLLPEPTAYVVLGGGLTEANPEQGFDSTDKQQPVSNEPIKHSSNDQSSNTQSRDSQSSAQQVKNTNTDTQTKAKKNPSSILAANNIVLNAYSLNRMKTVVAHYQQRPLPIIVTGVEAPWMRDWLLNHGIDNIITENASMNTCENARFTAKRLKLTRVFLITDAYHMTRTRRQFALNNIQTIPIAAPLPMQKNWLKPKDNAQHSRRTLYELAAYTRDVIAPQQNCRQADEVSFATLLRSRKPEDVKTF